jgi:hypothetical protein
MKSHVLAVSFFALSLAAVAPALAETADAGTCLDLGKQVGAALNDATGDVAAARAEQRQGQAACSQGLYGNGAAHYRKALSLAGK